jgi:hypothetical protein
MIFKFLVLLPLVIATSYFDTLPLELRHKVSSFLEPKDILNFKLTRKALGIDVRNGLIPEDKKERLFLKAVKENDLKYASRLLKEIGIKNEYLDRSISASKNETVKEILYDELVEMYRIQVKQHHIDISQLQKSYIRAAQNGNHKLVEFLLSETSVQPNFHPSFDHELRHAMENGHENVVRVLLNDDRVWRTNAEDSDGPNNFLYYSVFSTDNIVSMLLDDPLLDVNRDDNQLLEGFEGSRNWKVFQLLLNDSRFSPAFVEEEESWNIPFSPAFGEEEEPWSIIKIYAGLVGSYDYVKALLEDDRVSPDAESIFRALKASIRAGNYEIFDLLIRNAKTMLDSLTLITL